MAFHDWPNKINRHTPILSILFFEHSASASATSRVKSDASNNDYKGFKMAVALPENYQLKWHSFGSHLHSCVASSINSDMFCDVILHTLDGHNIQAHRFILSACSQYLHQVLKSQLKIASSLPLIIVLPSEINYKTLKILIQYMYSGEATVSKDVLENVLRGGDLLKVKGLWRPPEHSHEQHHNKKTSRRNSVQSNSAKSSNNDENSNANVNVNPKPPDPCSKEADVSKILINNHETSSSKFASAATATADSISSTAAEMTEMLLVEMTKPQIKDKECKVQVRNNDEEKIARTQPAISPDENLLQFLVIKQEPEWSENEDGMFGGGGDSNSEGVINAASVKSEITEDENEQEEQLYSPLTCELCLETFKLPGDWVRHIQSHTDMLPAKRQRRGGGGYNEEDNGSFPPLHCDMCSQYFPTPAEWVHHIQDAHTEFELHLSNRSSPKKLQQQQQQQQKQTGSSASQHKVCSVCNKKFPSHASMLIHKRTHTGERPYNCQFCSKGFNVKSNLLRHLRTLHDRIINSGEVPAGQEEIATN